MRHTYLLAGLWLAPRLDDGLPALLLCVLLVPVFVITSGFLWTSTPRPWRKRVGNTPEKRRRANAPPMSPSA